MRIHHPYRTLAITGLLSLALAGCGQSPGTASSPAATSPASQPASQAASGSASPPSGPSGSIAAGHQSPEAAVQGFLAADMAGAHPTACSYEAPAIQPSCEQAAGPVSQPAISGRYVIHGQVIAGGRALVEVTGSICMPSTGCASNADPAHGMPASAAEFSRAYGLAMNQGGFSPVPCVKVSGEWYVAIA